jgi:hypothetical protein
MDAMDNEKLDGDLFSFSSPQKRHHDRKVYKRKKGKNKSFYVALRYETKQIIACVRVLTASTRFSLSATQF